MAKSVDVKLTARENLWHQGHLYGLSGPTLAKRIAEMLAHVGLADRDNDRVSVSNDELLRVIRLWTEQAKDSTTNPYEALFPYVHPLVIGAVDRSSALSSMYW